MCGRILSNFAVLMLMESNAVINRPHEIDRIALVSPALLPLNLKSLLESRSSEIAPFSARCQDCTHRAQLRYEFKPDRAFVMRL
jgi:hypothetical protein